MRGSSSHPSADEDVATLRVKSEDGNHSYILKMHISETIGHLRQYLDKHRWGGPYQSSAEESLVLSVFFVLKEWKHWSDDRQA